MIILLKPGVKAAEQVTPVCMMLLIECESNNFIVEESQTRPGRVKNKHQAKNDYEDRDRLWYNMRKHLSKLLL